MPLHRRDKRERRRTCVQNNRDVDETRSVQVLHHHLHHSDRDHFNPGDSCWVCTGRQQAAGPASTGQQAESSMDAVVQAVRAEVPTLQPAGCGTTQQKPSGVAGTSTPVRNAEAYAASDFECAVCQELLLDPVAGPCGHDFCKACLEQWKKTSCPEEGGHCKAMQCPICRKDFPQNFGVCIRLKGLLEKVFPEETALRRQERQAKVEEVERRVRELNDLARCAAVQHQRSMQSVVPPQLVRMHPSQPGWPTPVQLPARPLGLPLPGGPASWDQDMGQQVLDSLMGGSYMASPSMSNYSSASAMTGLAATPVRAPPAAAVGPFLHSGLLPEMGSSGPLPFPTAFMPYHTPPPASSMHLMSTPVHPHSQPLHMLHAPSSGPGALPPLPPRRRSAGTGMPGSEPLRPGHGLGASQQLLPAFEQAALTPRRQPAAAELLMRAPSGHPMFAQQEFMRLDDDEEEEQQQAAWPLPVPQQLRMGEMQGMQGAPAEEVELCTPRYASAHPMPATTAAAECETPRMRGSGSGERSAPFFPLAAPATQDDLLATFGNGMEEFAAPSSHSSMLPPPPQQQQQPQQLSSQGQLQLKRSREEEEEAYRAGAAARPRTFAQRRLLFTPSASTALEAAAPPLLHSSPSMEAHSLNDLTSFRQEQAAAAQLPPRGPFVRSQTSDLTLGAAAAIAADAGARGHPLGLHAAAPGLALRGTNGNSIAAAAARCVSSDWLHRLDRPATAAAGSDAAAGSSGAAVVAPSEAAPSSLAGSVSGAVSAPGSRVEVPAMPWLLSSSSPCLLPSSSLPRDAAELAAADGLGLPRQQPLRPGLMLRSLPEVHSLSLHGGVSYEYPPLPEVPPMGGDVAMEDHSPIRASQGMNVPSIATTPAPAPRPAASPMQAGSMQGSKQGAGLATLGSPFTTPLRPVRAPTPTPETSRQLAPAATPRAPSGPLVPPSPRRMPASSGNLVPPSPRRQSSANLAGGGNAFCMPSPDEFLMPPPLPRARPGLQRSTSGIPRSSPHGAGQQSVPSILQLASPLRTMGRSLSAVERVSGPLHPAPAASGGMDAPPETPRACQRVPPSPFTPHGTRAAPTPAHAMGMSGPFSMPLPMLGMGMAAQAAPFLAPQALPPSLLMVREPPAAVSAAVSVPQPQGPVSVPDHVVAAQLQQLVERRTGGGVARAPPLPSQPWHHREADHTLRMSCTSALLPVFEKRYEELVAQGNSHHPRGAVFLYIAAIEEYLYHTTPSREEYGNLCTLHARMVQAVDALIRTDQPAAP